MRYKLIQWNGTSIRETYLQSNWERDLRSQLEYVDVNNYSFHWFIVLDHTGNTVVPYGRSIDYINRLAKETQ